MGRPGRPFDWTEIDPLLGQESDKELSARYHVSEGAIARRRNLAGIRRPPCNRSARKGPTDAQMRRDNERDALQRYQEIGHAGGVCGSQAGECVDRGWSWEIGG
jgi:hypothetical protein